MNRRQARRVAVAELRRRYRAVTDDVKQLIAMAFTSLFILLGVLGGAAAAYFAGGAIANGNVGDPLGPAALVGAALVLFVGFLIVVREMSRGGSPALDGHLTTVAADTLAAGYLVVEYAITGLIFVPLVVLGAGAFALGAGSPLAGLTVFVAAVAAWALAVPLWTAVVHAAKYAFARVPALARRKGLIGATAFAAYMWVAISGEFDTVLQPVLNALAATPAGWFAHLGLLPFGGDPLRGGASLAVAAVGTPLFAAVALRLADLVWHADPLPAEEPDETSVESSGAGVETYLPISRPTAAVVRRCWRRGRRSPITLVYVPYPLFFVAPPIAESLAAGRVTTTLPVVASLYAPWAVGAAFTLNPLGDEGVVLPATVTSGVGGRRYALGRILAGAIPGTPVAVVATLVLGFLSPLSAVATVALAGIVSVLCPAAAAVAAGFGATLPNTDSSEVFRGREAVLPSPWAFLGYSLVVVLAALPGVAVGVPLSGVVVGGAYGAGVGTVQATGTALTLGLGAVAGYAGYRVAARAVSTFEMG